MQNKEAGMAEFKIIYMDASTPYERGRQYGKQAEPEIHQSVHYYRRLFEKKQNWDEILAYALNYIPMVETYDKDSLEELKGIADASGHSLAEILVVNCRYEISKFDRVPKECTTGAVLPDATADGSTYVFKNMDLGSGVKPFLVLLSISTPDGYKGIGITEAGQLVRDGFNRDGLAMVNDALVSTEDFPGIGIPGTFVRKKIWKSKTIEEAENIILSATRTVSGNMIVGSSTGQALDFEQHPSQTDIICPENSILTHANRFTVKTEINAPYPHTHRRDVRMRELLSQKAPKITVEYLMDCLRDHKCYPDSICRHNDRDTHATVSSTIIDLSHRTAYICVGNPCQGNYTTYQL